MTVPGPWLDPPGTYTVDAAYLGYLSVDGNSASGLVRRSGSNLFNSGIGFELDSFHGTGGASFTTGVVEVGEQPMSGRTPQNFGAVRPPEAVGYEWENPSALAVPGATTIPALIQEGGPPFLRGTTNLGFGADSSTPRPEVQFEVHAGFRPYSAITLGPPDGLGNRPITSAPGFDGDPAAFPNVGEYALPAGTGGLLNYVVEDDFTLTIGSTGTSGWAVLEVIHDAVITGSPPVGYEFSTVSLFRFRSAQTPYAPASRFRWLFNEGPPPEPVEGSYGWGIRLV